MAQFDVYRNKNSATKHDVPYLLDIQADVLSVLSSRVVVPLIRANNIKKPIATLQPRFTIEKTIVFASVAELASVSSNTLGEKVISLIKHRSEIIVAIDLLFIGF